ncbi:type III secretion protein, partial [Salmonella enterica subsp. enterica]|nr:type III secretion protein [Salmonella enterica subsp. enterica]
MTGSTEIQALLRPDDGTFQVVSWSEPGL